MTRALTVRAYGALNDFLPPSQRHVPVAVTPETNASIKDVVERLGIPHPEIDLVLADEASVDFDFAPPPGCRIAVFPRFHSLDIGDVTRVRPAPLGSARFLLDGHLGKLAKHMRLLGLDAECPPGAADDVLARRAAAEGRTLLTRDVGLLKRRIVSHGHFVRETRPDRQIVEVLRRFRPLQLKPFTRCLRCNGALRDAATWEVKESLPQRTRESIRAFLVCGSCGRVYWKGAHWPRLSAFVERTIEALRDEEQGP